MRNYSCLFWCPRTNHELYLLLGVLNSHSQCSLLLPHLKHYHLLLGLCPSITFPKLISWISPIFANLRSRLCSALAAVYLSYFTPYPVCSGNKELCSSLSIFPPRSIFQNIILTEQAFNYQAQSPLCELSLGSSACPSIRRLTDSVRMAAIHLDSTDFPKYLCFMTPAYQTVPKSLQKRINVSLWWKIIK